MTSRCAAHTSAWERLMRAYLFTERFLVEELTMFSSFSFSTTHKFNYSSKFPTQSRRRCKLLARSRVLVNPTEEKRKKLLKTPNSNSTRKEVVGIARANVSCLYFRRYAEIKKFKSINKFGVLSEKDFCRFKWLCLTVNGNNLINLVVDLFWKHVPKSVKPLHESLEAPK